MNSYLQDIFKQPWELQKVLNVMCGESSQKVYEIAGLLRNANKIVLTSMGSAFYSLMPMFHELKKLRTGVELIETAELMQDRTAINADTLYLLMSRSGESFEVARFPSMLQEAGATCVSITMTPESTMAKHSDVVLADPAEYDALICTKAYTSMALCGLLCVSAMQPGYDSVALSARLEDMFQWMEENKEDLLECIQSIPFLSDTPSFYLLSRGYGMGVIKSGALWIEEASRKCSCISTLDNFYHGTIEVAQTDTVPLLLDVLSTERSDMIWRRINEIAKHTIRIAQTPCKIDGCTEILVPDFGAGEGYQMLALALVFQLFAYQNAVVNHLNVGALGTVSWVVQ